MKRNLMISIWMTLATTILLGVIYPLVVNAMAQYFLPDQANGELIQYGGKTVGSHLIGQPFTLAGYFHSRPSAAGPAGYDGNASGGSNLGPMNKVLIDRVSAGVQALHHENPNVDVPIDLVTTSASGLDPDITPAAAEFQVLRVARARNMTESDVRILVLKHTEGRQLGFLGELRVHVLDLNLDLDQSHPLH